MKCSYCSEIADFRCACQKPYMCPFHLGIHLRTHPKHNYQTLRFELEQSRLNQLRSNIIKRIQKIKLAKKSIAIKTISIINLIQNMFIQVNEQLDTISKSYKEFLKFSNFYSSDVKKIEEFESIEINIDTVEIDQIKKTITSAYSKDLISYEKKSENREIQFLKQHVGGFLCGVILKEGKILVTGGYDSTIRVWDLINEKQKFVLFGHSSYVKSIAVTRDPKIIISGSWDASIRIWNIHQKEQLAVLKGHTGRILGISYFENLSLIVSGDEKGEVFFWDFIKHEIVRKICFPGAVSTILLMKSRFSFIAGVSKTIIFTELSTLKESITLEQHIDRVNCITLTKDERLMISGSDDLSIIIWDLVQGKPIFQLNGLSGPINCLTLSLDEQFIISGSDDQTIRVWDMRTCTETVNFIGHTSIISSILQTSESFISLSEDSGIGILDMASGEFTVKNFLEPFKYDFIDFTVDKKYLGFGSQNEGAVWDVEKEVEVNILLCHEFEVISVEISKDCRFALSCSVGEEKNLVYWDLVKNQQIAELRGHTSSVFCACFYKDDFIAATGSADKTVRIWNLKERKQDSELTGHTGYVFSIKFISNKNLLVSAGCDGKVIIWNLFNKSQYAVLNGHRDWVWRVIVTEDDNFVVSCDFLEGIRVWNEENKEQAIMFSYQEEAFDWLMKNGIQLESVKKYLKLS